jgi:hypothetical protein
MPIYEEACKKLPSRNIPLETKDATYYLFSTDPLKGEVTYSTDQRHPANLQSITTSRAHEIIAMNKRGEKPISLQEDGSQKSEAKPHVDLAAGDISRFDKAKKKKKKKNNNNHPNNQKKEGKEKKDAE